MYKQFIRAESFIFSALCFYNVYIPRHFKWFLSQCHWNLVELEDFTNDFIGNELLDREVPISNKSEINNRKWLYGWLDAINIALYLCDKDKYRGRLPYYAFKKYPWLKDCTDCKLKTECSSFNMKCVCNSAWER